MLDPITRQTSSDLNVSPEVASLREALWAELARMRLLFGVLHHVYAQRTLLVEGLITGGALVWTLTWHKHKS